MEAQPSVGCVGEDAQLWAGGLDVKKEMYELRSLGSALVV